MLSLAGTESRWAQFPPSTQADLISGFSPGGCGPRGSLPPGSLAGVNGVQQGSCMSSDQVCPWNLGIPGSQVCRVQWNTFWAHLSMSGDTRAHLISVVSCALHLSLSDPLMRSLGGQRVHSTGEELFVCARNCVCLSVCFTGD